MKLALLSAVAKLLRIQFKVNGIPYGAHHQFREELLSQSAHGML